MPASSTSSGASQWRESWPPTQVHLSHPVKADDAAGTIQGKADDHMANDNPLSYFLTPTPLLSEDEEEDTYAVDDAESPYNYYDDTTMADIGYMDFEFDAGIEDASHPQPIVRSVSPSSLTEGLMSSRLPRVVRPPTPPRSHLPRRSSSAGGRSSRMGNYYDDEDPDLGLSDDAAAAEDADEESYVHFGTGQFDAFGSRPVHFNDYTAPKAGKTRSFKGKTSSSRLTHQQQFLPVSPPYSSSPSPLPSPSSPYLTPPSSSPTSRGSSGGSSSRLGPGPMVDVQDFFYSHPNNQNYAYHNSNNNYHHNYFGTDAAAAARGRAGAAIVRRRSPRSWRVPSPDVFSIEEETEEQLVSNTAGGGQQGAKEDSLDPTAAKPKKKHVRFVLPHEEIA